ncbi:MAG TPA: ABC transporter ATP-binding protein [Rhizomicrobium sp.]|nr:ABC transporter ATP-binding protein [Rhizomicrobium sp.]
MASMIALDHVSMSYSGTKASAVREVSLDIAKGCFFVLIGESGSGKTTTLHLINRLLEPDQGRVLVEGQDAATLNPVELRRGMGLIFQAIGLFPHMTVAQNVGITPKLLGWPAARIAERIDELLALVRLPADKFRHRYPAALSGGQKQRVGLARALAAQPKIMLMDEPFGALDPVTRDELSAEYREIHQTLGLTTVLVTHDMTEAFLLADQVAVMRDGRVVQSGTPAELLAAPADEFVRALIENPRRRARRLAEAMRAVSAA